MAAEQSYHDPEMGIVDAVEALTSIAELDFESRFGVAEPHVLTVGEKVVPFQTVHWLHGDHLDDSVEAVKDIFRVVLEYLQGFCKREEDHLRETRSLEHVKEIMLLVSDAAKNLDKFTSLLKGRKLKSVTHLPEFQKLYQFYNQHIAKHSADLAVSQDTPKKMSRRGAKISLARHGGLKSAVMNLDSVKKDLEYELFYIQKENGKPFYNPQLIRNLRLVSDFGDQFERREGKDPLIRVELWRDRQYQVVAQDILTAISPHMDSFYQYFSQYRGADLAGNINKMLMALMLSSNPRNLMNNQPVKSCSAYFGDFLNFLRFILESRSYQRLVDFPPDKSNRANWAMLDVTWGCCRGLYSIGKGLAEMEPLIESLLDDWRKEKGEDQVASGSSDTPLCDRIFESYEAVSELLKRHPNGPLNKMLKILDEGPPGAFDSLHQGNIPSRLGSLYYDHSKVTMLRLPSPTRQRSIKGATVVDEFRGFLHALARNPIRKKHLLINVQNRTSWQEHQRCVALEELGQDGKWKRHLSVVTLPKNTDFYHQRDPYHELNSVEDFKDVFIEHITGERTGFVLPPMIARVLTQKWLKSLLDGIQKVFFDGKNVLSRLDRMNFINIAYLLLTVKFIETVEPTTMSYTCKDAIDSGMASYIELNLFLTIMNNGEVTEEEFTKLQLWLHGPSLMIRERAMILSQFERLMACGRCVERARRNANSCQAFLSKVTRELGGLFSTGLLRQSIMKAPGATQAYS